jgi:phosphohistidine phosphatase
MRKLIVLRHAKAAAGLGLPDFERPLTSRGRRDAAAAGEWLSDARLRPDLVRCSPAERTRETLGRLGVESEVGFEPAIYDNDVGMLLELLGGTGDDVGTLLLIGHNPSLHQLVHDLTGDGGETFPTCAIAVIDIEGDWAGIRPGVGRRTGGWSPETSA